MADEAIPPIAQAFIAEHVESVLQLELLLLLASRPDRPATAASLVSELRVDAAWLDRQLAHMVQQGWLAAAGGPPAAYRFAPRTDDVRRAIAEVARAYNDRRVTVIGLIFAKPVDKIRSFADAFRIRREPTDG